MMAGNKPTPLSARDGLKLLGVLLLLVAPSILNRDIVYRRSLDRLAEESGGNYVLKSVPLERSKRYTVFLVFPEGFSFPPSINWTSSRDEEHVARLLDEHHSPIPNTLSGETQYGNLSEAGRNIAAFTAAGSGRQTLYLDLPLAGSRPPADYEIVIRRSGVPEIVRLMLGGNNAWLLLVFGGGWFWRQLKSSGQASYPAYNQRGRVGRDRQV